MAEIKNRIGEFLLSGQVLREEAGEAFGDQDGTGAGEDTPQAGDSLQTLESVITRTTKRLEGIEGMDPAQAPAPAPAPEKPQSFDLVGSIMAFEDGELDHEDTLRLFSHLIKTGMIHSLQGFYGRTANDLVQNGLLDNRGNIMEGVKFKDKKKPSKVKNAPASPPAPTDEEMAKWNDNRASQYKGWRGRPTKEGRGALPPADNHRASFRPEPHATETPTQAENDFQGDPTPEQKTNGPDFGKKGGTPVAKREGKKALWDKKADVGEPDKATPPAEEGKDIMRDLDTGKKVTEAQMRILVKKMIERGLTDAQIKNVIKTQFL